MNYGVTETVIADIPVGNFNQSNAFVILLLKVIKRTDNVYYSITNSLLPQSRNQLVRSFNSDFEAEVCLVWHGPFGLNSGSERIVFLDGTSHEDLIGEKVKEVEMIGGFLLKPEITIDILAKAVSQIGAKIIDYVVLS